ncbi:hypothetical protein [Radiobacillus sp. PE A8.2]|uniref:hypothetical protein n=1 Tax=Radiobacillus sp. PE A8.2 TaxID=3380349 RepID=UPI00388EA996
MKHYILFYSILFGLGLLLGFLQVDLILSFIIILLFGLLFVGITFHPILITKNVEKTENYLMNNKKNPVYHLYYAISNKLDNEVEDAMARALAKYKRPNKVAIFQVIYSMYHDDLDKAKQYVEFIPQKNYQLYYYASILIEENNLDDATIAAKELRASEWMKSIILGEIELKQENQNEAKQYIQKAFDKTRGMQRYSIYKHYQELLEK